MKKTTSQTIGIIGITALLLLVFTNIDKHQSETPKINVITSDVCINIS